MGTLAKFVSYLCGDFNNDAQVQEERKKGEQIHPESVHITRTCNDKIDNLPADFKGEFVLEESYYTKADGSKLIAPHLFLFEFNDNNKVQLKSYQVPDVVSKEDFVNSNPSLRMDYTKLALSPSFGVMEYEYSEDGGFYGSLKNEVAPNVFFTLTETIKADSLEVMELMEKNGVRLTTYDTPIIYNRI